MSVRLPPFAARSIFHDAHVHLYLKLFGKRQPPRPRVLTAKSVDYLTRMAREL